MPNGSNLGMFLAGLGLAAMGAGFLFAPGFARWALTVGRGRIWTRLLGEDRALKLTRYFFGPLLALLGLACVLGSFVLQKAGR